VLALRLYPLFRNGSNACFKVDLIPCPAELAPEPAAVKMAKAGAPRALRQVNGICPSVHTPNLAIKLIRV
jgi:hypothetical protein